MKIKYWAGLLAFLILAGVKNRCQAAEAAVADSGYTVVKIKLVEAAKYQISFYPAASAAYREENGYRVYRLKIPYNITCQLIIRDPLFKVMPEKGIIPPPQLSLFLKKGAEIMVEANAQIPVLSRVISEDKEVKEYEVYRSKQAQIAYRLWEITGRQVKLEKANDTIAAAALAKEARSILDERSSWEREFVSKYPESRGALEVFGLFYQRLESDKAWAIFKKFPDAYKKEGTGKEIAEFFTALRSTQPGNPVVSFKQRGMDGKLIDIDALKGKVLIIDFWGSWCGPCRKSHPHLKAIYSKYHDKDLEIIGIAQEGGSEKTREAIWRKAVQEDGMTWLHLLNNPEGYDLVKAYGVTAFPTKLIIDRQGKIVFRLIGSASETLDQKLKEIFGY